MLTTAELAQPQTPQWLRLTAATVSTGSPVLNASLADTYNTTSPFETRVEIPAVVQAVPAMAARLYNVSCTTYVPGTLPKSCFVDHSYCHG